MRSWLKVLPLMTLGLLLSPWADAQSRWQLGMGGAGNQVGTNAAIAQNGDFIVGGFNTLATGNRQPVLMRLTNTGTVVWQREYDLAGDAVFSGLRATADGGFIMAGTRTQAATTDNDIFVLKVDANGVLQWRYVYDNNNDEMAGRDAVTEVVGGFVVVGYTNPSVAGLPGTRNSVGIKLSATGGVLWQQVYPVVGPNRDMANSVIQSTSTEYIIVGEADNLPNISSYFMRVAATTGAVLGTNLYRQAAGVLYFQNILAGSAAGQFVVGTTASGLAGQDNGAVTISAAGVASVPVIRGAGSEERYPFATLASDGGTVVAGAAKENALAATDWDISLVKYSSLGALVWERYFGFPTADDSVAAVVRTPDNGYLLVGMSRGITMGGMDIYILKTDSMGTSACNQLVFASQAGNWTPITQGSAVAATPSSVPAAVAGTSSPISLPSLNPCCVGYNFNFLAQPVCFGDSTTLDVNVMSPDFQDVEFQWLITPLGSAFNTFGPLGDTTLLFTGTNTVRGIAVDTLTGCRDTVTQTATVNPLPILNAGPNLNLCFGDTVLIDALNTAASQWTVIPGGDANSIIPPANVTDINVHPDSTTAYQLVGLDGLGCSDTDTVLINVFPLPTVHAGPDTAICAGGTATLSATGAVNYVWLPGGATSPVLNVSPPFTQQYALLGTDINNCDNRDTVNVSVVNISINGNQADTVSYCLNDPGAMVDATVQGAGGLGCVYNWVPSTNLTPQNPSSSIVLLNPPVSTDYSVTVNCSVGGTVCSDNVTIHVRRVLPPALSVTPDTTVCLGDTISLSVAGASIYAWSPASAILSADTTLATILAAPAVATQYSVSAVDTTTGCDNTDTVNVGILTLPVISLLADTVICEGIQLVRPLPGGFVSYQWSPISALLNPADANLPNPVLAPTDTVDISAQVVDVNGCRAADTFRVSLIPSPTAFIQGEQFGDTVVCFGEQFFLTATGGINHLWFQPVFTFSNQIQVTAFDTTVYRAVASVNGCFSTVGDTATYTIYVVPPPSAAFTSPFFGCVGTPVDVSFSGSYWPDTLTSVDSLVWDWAGGAAVDTLPFDHYGVVWGDTGVKDITLTNFSPYCSRSGTAEVYISSNPVVSAGDTLVLCRFETANLQGAFTNLVPDVSCVVEWTPYAGLSNPFSLTPQVTADTAITYYLNVTCLGCLGNTDSTLLHVNLQPTAVIDTFLLTLCEGATVQLPGGGFGGSGNLSYQWSPDTVLVGTVPTPVLDNDTLAEPVFSGVAVGTYAMSLVVTDRVSGCQSTPAFIQVTVNPRPIVSAGPDQTICGGIGAGVFLQGSVSNQGFGNMVFQWTPPLNLSNPGIASPYATPPTTTIYTLQATNVTTGCTSATDAVTVNSVPRPIANAGPVDTVFVCPGGAAAVGGVPSQVGPNVGFFWSPNLGLNDSSLQFPTATPAYTTTYFVQVFSNGCLSDADSVVVAVNPQPVYRVNLPYVAICLGDSVEIGANPQLYPAYDFSWSPTSGLSNPGVANPLASPAATTTYQVTVGAAGCQGQLQDTVRVEVVPPPMANIPQTVFTVCPDSPDSIQLQVTDFGTTPQPFYWYWTPNSDISDTTAQSPWVKPSQTTFYYLTIVAGPCSTTYEFRVFVNTPIDAGIALTGDSVICEGGSVTLTASGGVGNATFQWLDNLSADPIRTVTPTDTTTFTVVVSEGICADTASVTLSTLGQPEAEFTYSLSAGCQDNAEGFTVTFNDQSSRAGFWAWDFGDGSPVSNSKDPVHTYNLPAGIATQTYTVRLTVAATGGCQATDVEQDLVLVQRRGVAAFGSEPLPGATLVMPFAQVRFADSSLRAASWFWDFGDGQTSTLRNPAHAFEQSGIYTVRLTITDPLGCTHSVEKGPYRVEGNVFEISNVITPNGDGQNDRWMPTLNGPEDFRVFIFDRHGALVYEGRKGTLGWAGTNAGNGQDVPPGVYFYQLEVYKLGTPDEVQRTLEGNITVLR